jgi:hypothetical protein
LGYLYAQLSLGAPLADQFAVYERGLKAFPQFFSLHFRIALALLPKWGGSNEALSSFIDTVVARSAPQTREQIYTRLWWFVDDATAEDTSIFEVGASWPRMKEGFESLLKNYPNSRWNKSYYASFACRAGDLTTYVRLRSQMGTMMYATAFPSNASIDVCDARTHGKRT